jgi:hypothetical protein
LDGPRASPGYNEQFARLRFHFAEARQSTVLRNPRQVLVTVKEEVEARALAGV